jgi:hypothetical protein
MRLMTKAAAVCLRGDTGSYAIHDREAGTVELRATHERQAS